MKSCELEFLIRNPVNQYKVVRERLGAHCRHKGVVRGERETHWSYWFMSILKSSWVQVSSSLMRTRDLGIILYGSWLCPLGSWFHLLNPSFFLKVSVCLQLSSFLIHFQNLEVGCLKTSFHFMLCSFQSKFPCFYRYNSLLNFMNLV